MTATPDPFVRGKTYTRATIAKAVGGGNLQSYLPTVDGKVVCGCFQSELNPDAPDVILPGTGPSREGCAAVLCRQGGTIPVFLKDDHARWRYLGRYEVDRSSTDEKDIKKHGGNRDDVTRVIWMRRVS